MKLVTLLLIALAGLCKAATWDLPAFRGNRYCAATSLSVGGTFNFSTHAPIVPPGDNACTVVYVDVSTLLVDVAGFRESAGFEFRQWLDPEWTWRIECAKAPGANVDDDSAWKEPEDCPEFVLPADLVLPAITGGKRDQRFNPYANQVGPAAFIPMRQPGLYRVTVTARLPKPSGGYATAVHHETLSALPFNGTVWYFDPDHGDDSLPGLGPKTAKRTGWEAFIEGGSNRVALLKVGTAAPHVVQSLNLRQHNNCHIGTYGATSVSDKAHIQPSGSSPAFAFNLNDPVATSCQTFCNLDVDLAGSAAIAISVFKGNAKASLRDVTFFGCAFHNPAPDRNASLIQCAGKAFDTFSGFNIVSCLFDQTGTPSKHAAFIGGCHSYAIVGNTFRGDGSNNVMDHHLYLSGDDGRLVSLNYFAATRNRNFAVNGNTTAGNHDWFHTLNYVDGPLRGFDCSGSNNLRHDGNHSDYLYDANFFRGCVDYAVWTYNGTDGTIRNNACVNCGLAAIAVKNERATADNWHRPRIDDNLVFTPGNQPAVRLAPGLASRIGIRGNREWYSQASPVCAAANAGHAPDGFTIDGNEYYAPDRSSDAVFIDSHSGDEKRLTFTEWRKLGFDQTGQLRQIAFPWNNPLNGNFSHAASTN